MQSVSFLNITYIKRYSHAKTHTHTILFLSYSSIDVALEDVICEFRDVDALFMRKFLSYFSIVSSRLFKALVLQSEC